MDIPAGEIVLQIKFTLLKYIENISKLSNKCSKITFICKKSFFIKFFTNFHMNFITIVKMKGKIDTNDFKQTDPLNGQGTIFTCMFEVILLLLSWYFALRG